MAASIVPGLVGHLLVVDDNAINHRVLTRALEVQGHRVAAAADGSAALAILRGEAAPGFDVVLLDVLMPELDGYATLAAIKGDPALRHLPVIMISALDELDSVIRCIALGAEDYLPKPFEPTLLRARLGASLEKKRLHDQEREYLRQVERLTSAAVAVEQDTFDPAMLAAVAARPDALGGLARVFGRMVREVHAREQRLRQQLERLRLDAEERQQAARETVASYLSMDRRQALARGETLPGRTVGAALFADISGFTPLAATLARELGWQRGAEELIRHLNTVLGALIEEVHGHRGSVVGFSGDAITCWFDADDGARAVGCALALQGAMARFAEIVTPGGTVLPLAVKVAVATGAARRLAVGDPRIELLEALAGRPLVEVAAGEQLAGRGEVLVAAATAAALGARLTVGAWRADPATGERFAVATALAGPSAAAPWPALPPGGLAADAVRPWLLPAIYERVRDGKSEFLAELRPAAVLFLGFRGLDFDADPEAGARLSAFVAWAQGILARHDGALLQVTIGDKGSNLYAAFGAPIAHEDDAARAVAAALELHAPPPDLAYIADIAIGLAYGPMRAGASGSGAYRSYAVQGSRTNLAARLMQAARGRVLCDEGIVRAAGGRATFETLPPIRVKGMAEPVAIFRPLAVGDERAIGALIDRLPAAQQLTLKVASVIGPAFPVALLRDIHPIAADRDRLDEHLRAIEGAGLAALRAADGEAGLEYAFGEGRVREVAYGLLLFAQRRRLHRAVAEWYERRHAGSLAAVAAVLAHHWERAEDPARAIAYLEQAGEHARARGAPDEAAAFLRAALVLDASRGVASAVFGATEADGERAEWE